MKTPVVDYRDFRLSRLNDPRFSHLKLLGGWIVYFIFYFLTENLIPAEKCHVIHCALDDLIPFNEYFFIPYTFWYVLIVISLLYFMLYNIENFKGLQKFIMVTQLLAMIVYIVYPSRQDMRPAEFERHNILTWYAGLLYAFDTSTGVCPSLHVAYSLGIASTWLKEKSCPWWLKILITLVCGLICIATAFVKQHSVVDIFAAIPVGIIAEIWIYGPYWKKKFSKTSMR